VNTSVGTIRGRVVDAPQGGRSVAEYLGIPFARPPVAELRYADPVPLDTLPSGISQLKPTVQVDLYSDIKVRTKKKHSSSCMALLILLKKIKRKGRKTTKYVR